MGKKTTRRKTRKKTLCVDNKGVGNDQKDTHDEGWGGVNEILQCNSKDSVSKEEEEASRTR